MHSNARCVEDYRSIHPLRIQRFCSGPVIGISATEIDLRIDGNVHNAEPCFLKRGMQIVQVVRLDRLEVWAPRFDTGHLEFTLHCFSKLLECHARLATVAITTMR